MGLIIGLSVAALAKVAYVAVWSVIEYRAEQRKQVVEQEYEDNTAEQVWRFVA